MTVIADTPITGPYNGNGSTTVFSFDFIVLAEDELVVTLTDINGVETVQTLTTHYSVSPTGGSYPANGTITMVTAPASGETLTLSRATALNQLTDLQNRKTVNPEVLETAFDRLTVIAQDLSEQLGRAVQLPISGGISNIVFPTPVASNLIGWNAAATGLQNYTPNTAALISLPAGSTDNAVPKFDGTSGDSFQNSGLVIDDNNDVTGIRNITTTGTLAAAGGMSISVAFPFFDMFDTDTADSQYRTQYNTGVVNHRVDLNGVEASPRVQWQIGGSATEAARLTLTGFSIGSSNPEVALDASDKTDAVALPVGTTAQRPSNSAGRFRWNSDLSNLEVNDGSAWNAVGAGAGAFRGNGGAKNTSSNQGDIFRVHAQTLTADVTIATTENAIAAGPLTVDDTYTLTVQGNLALV